MSKVQEEDDWMGYELIKAVENGKRRDIGQIFSSLLTKPLNATLEMTENCLALMRRVPNRKSHFFIYSVISHNKKECEEKDIKYCLETMKMANMELTDNPNRMVIQNLKLNRTLIWDRV